MIGVMIGVIIGLLLLIPMLILGGIGLLWWRKRGL